ncbi:MAG: SGNH/GDSL hydrolase family protein, partial [Rhodanobacteraceae bacterium]
MFKYVFRSLAILPIVALAACSGGGGSSGPSVTPPQTGNAILSRIVGVGDSLTAGYQSDGLLGVTGVTNPASIYPGNAVPPGQENGFWALFYEQAKNVGAASVYDPVTSPLPLINGPGLGNQLVLGAGNVPTATHASSCDSFNQAAFQLSTALSVVRADPNATVYDVAVPGQTAHEALAMIAPLTAPAQPPSCGYATNPADPTAGGLQSLVSDESGVFYPVLGGFVGKVTNPDQVDDAVSLHPTLATVWLGANDLLKFTFSGGQGAASDTPSQMQTDITQTIQKLQNAGAKVIVANLPDVLFTAQFFRGGAPPNPALCQLQNYVFCFTVAETTPSIVAGLEAQGVPSAVAQAQAPAIAQQVAQQVVTLI